MCVAHGCRIDILVGQWVPDYLLSGRVCVSSATCSARIFNNTLNISPSRLDLTVILVVTMSDSMLGG